MKKINLIICLLLIINIFSIKGTFAQDNGTLSRQAAETVGSNFFKQVLGNDATRASISVDNSNTIKSQSGLDAIHVINYRNGGYVLVSSSKNAYPILSFSKEGSFDISNINPAAEMFIENYANQIDYITTNSITSNEEINKAWQELSGNGANDNRSTKTLEPIVKTKWNQDYPYNKFCPPISNGPKGLTYAGCVATTMAQIMKFWDYPAKGKGSKEYLWSTYETVNFEGPYDWANMPLSLNGASPEQIDEVATLIFNCAISVEMKFGADGSSSYISNCPAALINYFNYGSGAKYINREHHKFSDYDWKKTLIEDLDKGHPILYGASHSVKKYGHAFVCDGYKDDVFFHFNFGWSGSGDGYYYVDLLNSKFEENKPETIINYFSLYQSAVINIVPKGKGVDYCNKLEYTQPNWTFDDGSGPNFYKNNSNCEWQINVQEPVFSKLKINFKRFDLSDTDVLRLYEGNNNSGKLIGEFTKDNRPGELITNSREVFINFETNDSGQAMGWEIIYQSVIFDGTSIEEDVFENITVYPNPVSNVLNIKGIDFDSTVSIYDICGKLLHSESNLKSESINLTDFSNGVYFVKVSSDAGNKTFKIIKE